MKRVRIENGIDSSIVIEVLGKRVFFVTNNSTKSRSSFLKKFEGFGIKATQVIVINVG